RKRVRILGVRSGIGGRDPGAVGAVDGLQASRLVEELRAGGLDTHWGEVLHANGADVANPTAAIAELSARIAQTVCEARAAGTTPLVIGGDHSCAIGTWSGVHAAARSQGALGLLWIDAHLDSHTPETSHTGLVYGMPLAALLGYGDRAFTECMTPGPKLLPEHVCVYGARSYEPEEWALLERIGVRVIGMREIERRGLDPTLQEALAIVRRAEGGYGLTIDLDALDPRDAPGVGTPAPGGLRAARLIPALAEVGSDSRLNALEIAEYNPGRDRRGVTRGHAIALASSVLGAKPGEARRRVARVA
ncbi:MAG: arginase, partial [Betaproteobacteria bacterium]